MTDARLRLAASLAAATLALWLAVIAMGGASWERVVAPRLRAAGHLVFAPTLTGLGDRSHPSSPEVDLDTHARDVANVLFDEDLTDAVLAGHSCGFRA